MKTSEIIAIFEEQVITLGVEVALENMKQNLGDHWEQAFELEQSFLKLGYRYDFDQTIIPFEKYPKLQGSMRRAFKETLPDNNMLKARYKEQHNQMLKRLNETNYRDVLGKGVTCNDGYRDVEFNYWVDRTVRTEISKTSAHLTGEFIDDEQFPYCIFNRQGVADVCSPFLGKEYAWDNPLKDEYPKHPNCKCLVIPLDPLVGDSYKDYLPAFTSEQAKQYDDLNLQARKLEREWRKSQRLGEDFDKSQFDKIIEFNKQQKEPSNRIASKYFKLSDNSTNRK